MLVGYRIGDMWAPQLEMREALGVELRQFVKCIEHQTVPLTDGHAGLRVVRILEAATQSMAERGRVIELTPDEEHRMIPFLDLKAQYASIKAEIDAAVFQTLESSQFVLGEEVALSSASLPTIVRPDMALR